MGDTTADTSDPTDTAAVDGDHPVPLVTPISTSSEIHPAPSESSNHSVLIIDDDDDDEEKRQAVLPDDGSSSDSDGCEIISVDSDDEDDDGEGRWRSVSDPLNRLNALISAGYDNPRLLLTRIFGMDESILPTSSSSLWGIIYNILSDPTPRRRLKQYSTLDSVVKLINSSSRILVLTGAGISVSCGIPDFRSRDGIYARLAQDYPDLTSPQAMFEMDFFLHNPLPFFKFAKEIFPGQFKPSLAHWFISLLERKGKLLRNYTQNIDTLEQQAGISRIIQCHGSFATATCTTCSYRVPGDAIRDSILGQTVPRCPKCCPSPPVGLSNGKAGQFSPTNAGGTSTDESTTGPDAPTPILSRCLRSRGPIRPPPEISSAGVMKPDIVFFGEGLPSEFHSSLAEDIKQTDLVIVMGSSLKVRPVSHIPFSIPVSVPQVLINRESLSSHTFDVELLGDCDVVLDELCSRLGWRVPQDSSVPLEETVVPPASKRTEVDLRVPLKAAVMSRHQPQTSVHTQKEVEGEDVESTKATIELSDPQSTEPACDVTATKATVLEPAGPTGDHDSTLKTVSLPVEEVSETKTRPLSTEAVSVEVLPDESATLMTTESRKMCSQPSGDNRGTGGESSPIDVDRLVDADDLETDFHLAKFLQENTFTRIPPNQYIFKGAELPFDYEMAEDCLQHEGDLFGDPSSSSSPDSSSASLSPSAFSELAAGSETSRNVAAEEVNHRGDRVVARLLRKCRADPELQRCLQAKAESCGASNGSLSANHERPETVVNAVPQDAGKDEKGEDEDCVILSDPSLSPPTSQQKTNDKGLPTEDTGLVAKSTDGADFPNAKRRKCDPTKADPPPSPPTASSAQSPVPATDAAATAAL
ncbi:NAD-dependent protein deacetylase sirtuin-1 [Sparganum proliferum]